MGPSGLSYLSILQMLQEFKLGYRKSHLVNSLYTVLSSIVTKISIYSSFVHEGGSSMRRVQVDLCAQCTHRLWLAGRTPLGLCVSRYVSRNPVAPLKATPGTQVNRHFPFFRNPDPLIFGNSPPLVLGSYHSWFIDQGSVHLLLILRR